MNNFAERLRYLREEHGFTQRELAKICNVSPQCICSLEQGTRFPTGSTVAELARVLNVSSDYLLGLENDFGVRGVGTADSSYSSEERQVIENYRALNASGKKLINDTIKTLLAATAGSDRKKNIS